MLRLGLRLILPGRLLHRNPSASFSTFASTEQIKHLNMMFEALGPTKQKELFGRSLSHLPPFHLPKGVEPSVISQQYLDSAYGNARSQPHQREMFFRRPDYTPEPRDLSHRLLNGCEGKEELSRRLLWWSEAKPGDIFPNFPYGQTQAHTRYDFSNYAIDNQVVKAGTVHAAVGFVDLGILAQCQLEDDAERGPLHFVGYELSAHSVAKTRVLWQLLS